MGDKLIKRLVLMSFSFYIFVIFLWEDGGKYQINCRLILLFAHFSLFSFSAFDLNPP